MKKYLTCLIVALSFNFTFSFLAMAEDAPLIANHKKAIGFGVWRIYNTGDELLIIDEKDRRFFQVDWTTNANVFVINRRPFGLQNLGTISESSALHSSTDEPIKNREKALAIKLNAHIKDGRYSYGAKRFDVIGETLAIFMQGQAGLLAGDTIPITIIKKYSNGLEHYGTRLSQTIEPSVVIDVNDVQGPALIQGDCLATYSPETGRVEIPCLNIKGRNTIYSVGQQKHTDRLTFDVDENDVIRIQ